MDTAATPTTPTLTVRRGDTLVALARGWYRSQGQPLDERQAFSAALRLARGNGLADADRIQPGQVLRADMLPPAADLSPARAAGPAAPAAPAGAAGSPPATARVLAGRQPVSVFERTLDRAVQRGWIPPEEVAAVRERVQQLARDYGFRPDDLAHVALLESDGFNPAASNGSCHGIIQFCGGTNRGAASVGMAGNPQAIRRMSVLQQLELVDRYFQDVGLPRGGRVPLDELYLAVLTPAARAQRAADAPLPVAGLQARVLYEGNQPDAAITRRSIVQGLVRNARERLGLAADGNEPPQQRQALAAGGTPRT